MKYGMDTAVAQAFVQHVNENIGIAHKVCMIYFPASDEREDVLQEIMYQLWKSYKSFDGRSKFSTWMYSVCLNTVLTYIRKVKRRNEQPLEEAHREIADGCSPEPDDGIALIFGAIATLSPLNKAIMLLYLEDMTYEEIAAITGLSKANISVKLVRIKKELESKLKQKRKSIKDVNDR